MSLDGLYNSVVRVEAIGKRRENGAVVTDWYPVDDPRLQKLKCRLDLNFLRPGKDAPPATNAGVVPNRVGIMFTKTKTGLRAGHRIVTIPNRRGEMPVEGTFEIKQIPDDALGFSKAHHVEVQITEVTNKTRADLAKPEEEETP